MSELINIPPMQETDEPLEGARKYLVDYTEKLRVEHAEPEWAKRPDLNWRDYEVLSLTIQYLLEHILKLTKRIEELEKKN